MRVSSSEGVANHTVPESCAGAREGFGEALTGVRIGWVLSRENNTLGTPTLCFEWKATRTGAPVRPPGRSGAVADPSMCVSSLRRNREISPPARTIKAGPHREGNEPKPVMHGDEKSDPYIVAGKPANRIGATEAERVERREGTEENTGQANTRRTPSRASVYLGLDRVRTAARLNRKERFTAFVHHVDTGLLRSAYFWLKRDAAAGADGITWQEYREDLERKLADLHARIHRGLTGRNPHAGTTYQNPTVGSARSASLHWRTRSSSVRWSRC